MTVTSLYNNTQHINVLRDNGYGPADFDIALSEVYTPARDGRPEGMQLVPNRRVSYRTDTGEVLGHHSRRYKAVDHRTGMIDPLRRIIEHSSLNARGITENISIGNNGARCYVILDLPNHSITTPDGDSVNLRFLGTNSYDGSFPLILSTGGKQGACLNSQVFVSSSAALYKSRHTLSLDVAHGARIIANGINVLEHEAGMWHEWAKKHITSGTAARLFKAITKVKEGSRSTAYNYLMDKYLTHYRRTMGGNLWAVYNTLTDWSTHAPSLRGNPANIATLKSRRADKVREFISTEERFKIAA